MKKLSYYLIFFKAKKFLLIFIVLFFITNVMFSINASFRCKKCPKVYTTKFSLQRHERHHANDRKFDCFICGDNFLEKQHLADHMESHERLLRHIDIKLFPLMQLAIIATKEK